MKLRIWKTLWTALFLLAFSSEVVAAAASVYPGATLDEKQTREARDTAAKAKAKTKASVYVTPDPFETVLVFYKRSAREYRRPATSPGHLKTLPSGKVARRAYFIFDGAADLASSKHWVKIQRPYVSIDQEEGPDMTYISIIEKP